MADSAIKDIRGVGTPKTLDPVDLYELPPTVEEFHIGEMQNLAITVNAKLRDGARVKPGCLMADPSGRWAAVVLENVTVSE